MKVRILTCMVGRRFVRNRGDVVDLPDAEAERLIASRFAEPTEPEPVSPPPPPPAAPTGRHPLTVEQVNGLANVSDGEAAAYADLLERIGGRDPTDSELTDIRGIGPGTLRAYRAKQAQLAGAAAVQGDPTPPKEQAIDPNAIAPETTDDPQA